MATPNVARSMFFIEDAVGNQSRHRLQNGKLSPKAKCDAYKAANMGGLRFTGPAGAVAANLWAELRARLAETYEAQLTYGQNFAHDSPQLTRLS